MADEILLTQEGYDKIVAEHEELVSVRRKKSPRSSRKQSLTATFPRTRNMTLQRMSRQKWKSVSSSWRI